jgi:threonine dehydrogenase-like Zn-dependent dehydrogenase
MKTRACVLHGKCDVRIETREIGDLGPRQVRVRIGAGGLCGSDIHYFRDGGIGTIQVSEPIILGHEVAGTVEAVGGAVAKEIRLAGTHRFHAEYPIAARLIAERRIDVRPITTATLPIERIHDAFDVVHDRSSRMKVQLSFASGR